jgi:exoribonuclease R
LTISLKEKEHTREKLDGLDYSEYAEEISEKSYSARKASKDCVALFHCLLLKEHGQRVYESLIFNIENDKIGIYIDELNMHFNIKLRDDPRIDQTTFFENDLSIVMSFRNP